MSFNSSHVVVRGHAVNNVEGNQVNTSQTITAEVVHINGHREKERTEYDEFEEVKRGHIVTLERLHTEDLSNRELEWELKDGELVHKPARSTKRSICTVQVRPDQQTKYTAVVYDGEDSHVWWKDDFERFSRAGLGAPDTWQLYGLNRSKVPLLIFHDASDFNRFYVAEMVPLASFYKESFWGDFYVYMLREHLRCLSWQIWLNMRGDKS
ncbi:hypothetical protein VNI00_010038 [Paramarasmius palmivorus]|uniref:Uncharacterized protein n=1 Tax=Paramarasmius palmivorus TaxID=297713 RepID=A0AAW0CN64_9AGAR